MHPGDAATAAPVPRAGLPRAARVRVRREFTAVFEGGRRFAHPLLSLHWLCDTLPPRLGLAVSRKVDPHAVGRNRIKRVLRDAFRRSRSQLAPGAYVVVARQAASQVDGATLRAAFHDVLRRAGALPREHEGGTMPNAAAPEAARQAAVLPLSPLPRPRAG